MCGSILHPAETLIVRGHLRQQALQQLVAQAAAGQPRINESVVLNSFGHRLFRSTWLVLLPIAIWALLEFSLQLKREKTQLIATVSGTKEGTISALVQESVLPYAGKRAFSASSSVTPNKESRKQQ